MKKINVLSTIFIILMFLIQPFYLFAECYNEDACYKDYVTANDKDVVLAVNRDTKQVELYWSEKDNTWIKPDAGYQQDLQKIYNKRLQLMEMQSRMNSMHNSTWYTTNEVGSGHR
jgi:hypothetical protein